MGCLWCSPGIVRERIRNELTRNSLGSIQPQLSQLTEPLLTNPGEKSGISVQANLHTQTQKAQAGNEWANILPKSSLGRKKLAPVSLQASQLCLQPASNYPKSVHTWSMHPTTHLTNQSFHYDLIKHLHKLKVLFSYP